MAHYLLKKRIMLQMQQKEKNDTDLPFISSLSDIDTSVKTTHCAVSKQTTESDKHILSGLPNEAHDIKATRTSYLKAPVPATYNGYSGHEHVHLHTTENNPLMKGDAGDSLSVCRPVENSQDSCNTQHEINRATDTQRLKQEYQSTTSGIESGQSCLYNDCIGLEKVNDRDRNSYGITDEPQNAERQEKTWLVGKILDILKSNVENPKLGLEAVNKKELSECFNLLSGKYNTHTESMSFQSMLGMLDQQKDIKRSLLSGPAVSQLHEVHQRSPQYWSNQSTHQDCQHVFGDVSSEEMKGIYSKSVTCHPGLPYGQSSSHMVTHSLRQNRVPSFTSCISSLNKNASLQCECPNTCDCGFPSSLRDAQEHTDLQRQGSSKMGKNNFVPMTENCSSDINSGTPDFKFNNQFMEISSMDHFSTPSSYLYSTTPITLKLHEPTSRDAFPLNTVDKVGRYPHVTEACGKDNQNVLFDKLNTSSTSATDNGISTSQSIPVQDQCVEGFTDMNSVNPSEQQESLSLVSADSHCPRMSRLSEHTQQVYESSKSDLNSGSPGQSVVSSSGCHLKHKKISRCQGASRALAYSSNPITSSGRNKGQGKLNDPKYSCEVCGDVAAGYHCGAYICEACKKFYLRCLKNDGNLLTCPKSQGCVINKDNRSHCQYCRYHKCLKLGMYRPGREIDKKLKVDFKSIPCKVCCAPSSGFHFGAITCEGCKGFFRRMLKENLHQKFTCSSGGSCEITSSNRTFCKCCRFNKCLHVGMTLEGTRLGRQSNSVKRTTLIAHNLRTACDGTNPNETIPVEQIKKETDDDSCDGSTRSTIFKAPFSPTIKDDIEIIDDIAEISLEVLENIEFDTNFLEPERSSKRRNVLSVRKQTNKKMKTSDKPGQYSSAGKVDNCCADLVGYEIGGCLGQQSEKVHSSKPTTKDLNHCENQIFLTHSGCHSADPGGSTTNTDHFDQGNMLPIMNNQSGHRESSVDLDHTDSIPVTSASSHLTCSAVATNSQRGLTTPSGTTTSESCHVLSSHSKSNKVPSIEIYQDSERTIHYLTKIYKLLDGLSKKPSNQLDYLLDVNDYQNIWTFCMLSFVRDACLILKYLKAIPGFRDLPQAKQVSLTQETMYPVCLLFHGQRRDPLTKKTPFFSLTEDERDLFFGTFPIFKAMSQHFQQCGDWVSELELDHVEIALLNVIFILTTASDRCVSSKPIYGNVEDLALVFMDYCSGKDVLRGGLLLAKMAELRRCNIEHQEMAFLMKQENQHIDYGPLWTEVFVQK